MKIKWTLSLVFLSVSGAFCASGNHIGWSQQGQLGGQGNSLGSNNDFSRSIITWAQQIQPDEQGNNQFSNGELHDVIINGDTDAISGYINSGYDLEEPLDDPGDECHSYTPAMVAAQQGDLETLILLYTSGANLNADDGRVDRDTVLTVAILERQFEVIKWLLDLKNPQGEWVVDRYKEGGNDDELMPPFFYVLDRLNYYFSNHIIELSDDGEFIFKEHENDVNARYNWPNYYALFRKFLADDLNVINKPNTQGKTPYKYVNDHGFDKNLLSVLRNLGAKGE